MKTIPHANPFIDESRAVPDRSPDRHPHGQDAAGAALPDAEHEPLLTSHEAAKLLNVSTVQLVRLARTGHGPAHYRMAPTQRAHLRFKRSDIIRWLDERRIPMGRSVMAGEKIRPFRRKEA